MLFFLSPHNFMRWEFSLFGNIFCSLRSSTDAKKNGLFGDIFKVGGGGIDTM